MKIIKQWQEAAHEALLTWRGVASDSPPPENPVHTEYKRLSALLSIPKGDGADSISISGDYPNGEVAYICSHEWDGMPVIHSIKVNYRDIPKLIKALEYERERLFKQQISTLERDYAYQP